MPQRTSLPASLSLPDEVYEQASIYQLGSMTGLFMPTFSNLFVLIGIVIGSIIIDLILLIGIIYFTGVVIYYLALFPLFVLIGAIGAFPNHNLRIYVFDNGLLRAKGKRYEVARWDEITEVWQKSGRNSYRISAFTCLLKLQDGRTLKLTDAVRFVHYLAGIVQEEVGAKLLPTALLTYKSGETVRFGKINVNIQGINNGKELVPWNQVDSLFAKEGQLFVQKHGRLLKWSVVKVNEIPNLGVLAALVDSIVKDSGSQQTS
ncbi:DUF6585 family protein [Tengunoibacter tsumagoiensis]|uniref:Uncharacterized protein n=1 Tax=Tengunoibacter tsumagoiensis TaxID=2014871 RepID=A0A402AAD0_9CHLR|nr:DUF6585 family protein [Tengunoibacter tsumagoiensis]GCE16123.1 hypothetical protein KTT_59820 [Tengunoibacter tsumagoiensis]